jgi:hypothetical protein
MWAVAFARRRVLAGYPYRVRVVVRSRTGLDDVRALISSPLTEAKARPVSITALDCDSWRQLLFSAQPDVFVHVAVEDDGTVVGVLDVVPDVLVVTSDEWCLG